ncbi:MAG: XRE family transcriptional regulator [Bacteroidaceae bacterium]|nr:XRE family transcriptional regulator [Bacteroidaceae bacterium]
MAKELSCNRTKVYRIYEKSSIDISLLMRISTILKFNFFELFAQEFEEIQSKKQEE